MANACQKFCVYAREKFFCQGTPPSTAPFLPLPQQLPYTFP